MDVPELMIPLPLRPKIVAGLRELDTPKSLHRIRKQECVAVVTVDGDATLYDIRSRVLHMPSCFLQWHLQKKLQRKLLVPLMLIDPDVPQGLIGLGAWLPFHDGVLLLYYGDNGTGERPELWDFMSTTMRCGEVEQDEVQERISMLHEHHVVPSLGAMPIRIASFR